MTSYKYIINPMTGRRVSVLSKTGKTIINNYINQLGGGLCGFDNKTKRCNRKSVGNKEYLCEMGDRGSCRRNKTLDREAVHFGVGFAPTAPTSSSAPVPLHSRTPAPSRMPVPLHASVTPSTIEKGKVGKLPTKYKGCIQITEKNSIPSKYTKYSKRKSPPYPANECKEGMRMVGNDGNMYSVSKPDKNGVKRWRKIV